MLSNEYICIHHYSFDNINETVEERGGGGGAALKNSPIKTTPSMRRLPPPLKNEAPLQLKNNLPPPLKNEVPFEKMNPRKKYP